MFVSLLFTNTLSKGAKWQPKSIWFQSQGLWWVSSSPLVTWASPSTWTGFLISRPIQHQHQCCLVRGSLCTFSCDISNNHLLFLHLSPWISVLPSSSPRLQFLDDRFFSLSFLPCICLNLTNKMVPLLSAEAPSESTKPVYLVHSKSTACSLCSNSRVTTCTEKVYGVSTFSNKWIFILKLPHSRYYMRRNTSNPYFKALIW